MKFRALSLFFPMESIIKDAQAFVDDVSNRHDIPHGPNVPADLADKEGTWQLNSKGYPVAGMLLPEDSSIGSSSPALPLYIGLYALVAVLMGLLPQLGLGVFVPFILLAYFIGFFCYFGIFGTIFFALVTLGSALLIPYAANIIGSFGLKYGYLQSLFNLIPAFAPLVYLINKTKTRGSELAYQGTQNAQAIIRAPKAIMNEERHIQALNADEDKSPLIIFGTATGALSFNGDSFAPDKGLPVVMSEEDISTHMHVFGSTGTGKTTELRTILKSIAN